MTEIDPCDPSINYVGSESPDHGLPLRLSLALQITSEATLLNLIAKADPAAKSTVRLPPRESTPIFSFASAETPS